MQEIEAKYFHLIAGAGNFADNRGSNGRVNNNGGNKNGGGKSSDGNMYQKHTSPDCINGIITGSLGGLGGLALGALNGGCFKEASKGGGNVGMGQGGNKSNCNNNSNKGGNTCSR
ncbi:MULTISPECIES: hypothetical protein [Serratia]|nr:hypothetical protein [Serratia marcescens]MBE8812425.1 hypothetical protein [Serratia marcescens]MBS6085377.1 hypothetical protein [Serratia marcescens]MCG5376689.1 hypothetical protein [Serratia marcescens]CVG43851.1 Uncharacterised protein [Serratia marcescens]CVG63590.1 Uncharacterised protein [Serratia marcescens]